MTPQQSKIIEMLSDGRYHCPTKELYMKDDRTRFSELRDMGYGFDSPRCTLCIDHSSRVLMRKMIKKPEVKQEAKPRITLPPAFPQKVRQETPMFVLKT